MERRWPDTSIELTYIELAPRLRRQLNIKPTLDQRIVLPGLFIWLTWKSGIIYFTHSYGEIRKYNLQDLR